jgi:hypothetical protein
MDLSCFTRGLISRSHSTPSTSNAPMAGLKTPNAPPKPIERERQVAPPVPLKASDPSLAAPVPMLSPVPTAKASSAKKTSGGQKNLRDFFAASKPSKEKKASVGHGAGVTVLDRSRTCPVSLAQVSPSFHEREGRHSTSPFQSHSRDKAKVSVLDSMIQSANKRQRKSYPLLSTKVRSLSL